MNNKLYNKIQLVLISIIFVLSVLDVIMSFYKMGSGSNPSWLGYCCNLTTIMFLAITIFVDYMQKLNDDDEE